MWWLTAAADQGRSDHDNERRPQPIPLIDECPPSFIDLRASSLSAQNNERTLSIGALND
jgi:hypothetical protein